MKLRNVKFVLVALLITVAFGSSAYAKGKTRSGAFNTSRGNSGTFQQNVARQKGSVEKNTTWQNQRGEQGSHNVARNWDKKTGTGTYATSTTGAKGKTFSREGTLTKTENGLTQQGTITRANGNEIQVNRTAVKNPDGTYSTQATYTGENGKTLTTNGSVTKTENGRTVTGSYSTSGGKSGTFQSGVEHTADGTTVNRSVTNQDGKTATQDVTRTHKDGTLTRTATHTGFKGKTGSNTETMTVNPPSSGKTL